MPTWEQVALTLSNEPITVGKLDCTKHTSVTSELKINGYPTVRIPEVRPLSDRYELVRVCEKLKKTAFFLLAGEKNVSNPLIVREFEEYYAVAKKLFSKTYFYQILPRHLPSTFPCDETVCIFVVKDGTQFLYNPTTDQNSLEKWIQSSRWPFMQLAKYETLNEMGECCNDKLLVVAVLDLVEKRKLKSPVKQLDDLIRMTWQQYSEQLKGKFQFVWLDGNEIANSILLRTVPVPCLFVFNASSYSYYLPDQDALQMTEEILLQFLQNVVNGFVAMRGGKGRVQHVRRIFYETTTAIYVNFFSSTNRLLASVYCYANFIVLDFRRCSPISHCWRAVCSACRWEFSALYVTQSVQRTFPSIATKSTRTATIPVNLFKFIIFFLYLNFFHLVKLSTTATDSDDHEKEE
ncbi:conserved hypothetical protein [Trichinella spiralis]|uniref:hypothetical protein n=1 Tax=Trichinella spiralis TaxID=6334 RepID=UPI0001EFEE87|nr:conserved hypothetical protein [Trichinella spiralis]